MIKWALAVVVVLNVSAFLTGFAYLGPRIDGSIIYSDAIAHLAPDAPVTVDENAFDIAQR